MIWFEFKVNVDIIKYLQKVSCFVKTYLTKYANQSAARFRKINQSVPLRTKITWFVIRNWVYSEVGQLPLKSELKGKLTWKFIDRNWLVALKNFPLSSANGISEWKLKISFFVLLEI